MRTDDRGWPVYNFVNNNLETMWLHFYDEGLFYDGFYVINDLEVSFLITFSRTKMIMIPRMGMLRLMDECSSITLTVMIVWRTLVETGITGMSTKMTGTGTTPST